MRFRFLAGLLVMMASFAHGADVFAPEPASGPPSLSAAYPADGAPPVGLGKLSVAGVGEVTFYANLVKGRLVVTAVDGRETKIGRAESIAGLGDTSIYIQSPRGLLKVTIRWKTN